MILKTKPIEDPRYRAWIRTLPCLVTDCPCRSECAHTGDRGLGQKASCRQAIPLCGGHHRVRSDSYHRIGREAFEKLYGLNLRIAIKQLNDTYNALYPSRAVEQEQAPEPANPVLGGGCTLQDLMRRAELMAWQSLASGMFSAFAHWQGEFRNLNSLLPKPVPDPFETVRALGRAMSGMEANDGGMAA